MSTKIELLENELEKNEAKIDLLQYECDQLWGEIEEKQAKLSNITDMKYNVKKINEKINKKIIKLKQINNNIV
jgi:ABC-type enterochelin transport system substrate-binding protein